MEDEQYCSGVNFGWDESVRVHRTAIIVGTVQVGKHSRIDAFSVITGNVRIGPYSHIGHGSAIFGGMGVVMGRGCSLSPGAKIFTATDDVHDEYLANPQIPHSRSISGPVYVGDYSVIGANSVVLPNVEIGDECQIGANAVLRVNAKVPNNQVWVGNPAHYLNHRKQLDRAAMMGYEIPANTGA